MWLRSRLGRKKRIGCRRYRYGCGGTGKEHWMNEEVHDIASKESKLLKYIWKRESGCGR
jgi:hypothetical protein